jgi:hypothetical protein
VRLSANAKLLYGEITALCNKEGYCWAGNQYFAELYGTTPRTARRWITELETGGYVTIGYKYVDGTNAIETRRIRITAAGMDKNVPTYGQSHPEPYTETHGNTDTETAAQPQAPPEPEPEAPAGGDKNVITYGQKCQGVGTKMSEGDDKNATHNITSINTKESSSSPETKKDEDDKKIPVENKDLRNMFLEVDKTFIFDDIFYMNAAQFLEDNELPDEYVYWLYKICKEQKPVKLRNYYYKMFFSGQMTELYKRHKKPPDTPGQRYEPCPVCGETVESNEPVCQHCRFDIRDKGDGAKLNAARERYKNRSAKIAELRAKGLGSAQIIKEIAGMNKRSSA